MAQVDFTNARLELIGTVSPVSQAYVNLDTAVLYNASGQAINGNYSISWLVNEQKKALASYSGLFTASGTEFYLHSNTNSKWKVSNISFQNGDSYTFQIPVSLTCL